MDSAGVAYLTGYTTSVDFPSVGATQTSPSASFLNGFVAKLDPSQYGGDGLIFSSYLNGTDGDTVVNGVAAGKDGRIYLIGTTKASDFPVTANGYQAVRWGAQDAFVAKMDPGTGGIDYATYLGGEDLDDGRNILVDNNGLTYFAVSTLSTQFPMAGFSINGNASGGADVVVGVMDLNKQGNDSLKYATYFGGSGNEEVRAMAFDGKGGVFITGYTLSTDFPLTPDAIQRVNYGGGDVFVAEIDPSQSFQRGMLYSTYLGGQSGRRGVRRRHRRGGRYLCHRAIRSRRTSRRPARSRRPTGAGAPTSSSPSSKPECRARRRSSFRPTWAIPISTCLPRWSSGADGRVYVTGWGGIGLPSSQYGLQGGYAGGGTDGFLFVLTPDAPSQTQTQQTPETLTVGRRHSGVRSNIRAPR